jgi:hypothetical protein
LDKALMSSSVNSLVVVAFAQHFSQRRNVPRQANVSGQALFEQFFLLDDVAGTFDECKRLSNSLGASGIGWLPD